MALVVERSSYLGAVIAPRPLFFGVGERYGLRAYDPAADDATNHAQGMIDGYPIGSANGASDAAAGLSKSPPYSVDSPTGSGAYDGGWVEGAQNGYENAFNATMKAKTGAPPATDTTKPVIYIPPYPTPAPAPKPGPAPAPAPAPAEAADDHTLLYVGLGVAGVAIVGGVIWYVAKKKRRSPSRRRSNPRRRSRSRRRAR